MAATHTSLATFADLAALGDDIRAEIVHGVIVEKASPSGQHGTSQVTFGITLGRRFQRKPGGRWPGGWWFGTEIDIQYETHEIYVHDVVGWRRDRVPEPPTGRPIRTRPDWACELLSPSTSKRDRVDKFEVLHANQVPHYWIADPIEQRLVVYRWEPEAYREILTAGMPDVVRAEPFEATELRLAVLFGTEDDEE